MKKKVLLFLLFALVSCNSSSSSGNVIHSGTSDDSSSENIVNSEIEVDKNEEFNDMDNFSLFSANVQNALGLSLSKKRVNSPKREKKRNQEDYETVQTLVKTTTEYDSNDPKINDDGTIDVTFTRIDTTVKTNEIEGQKTLYAIPKDELYTAKITDYGNDSLTFETSVDYEYRVVNKDGYVFRDWEAGSGEPLTVFLETSKNDKELEYYVYKKSFLTQEDKEKTISIKEAQKYINFKIRESSFRKNYGEEKKLFWETYNYVLVDDEENVISEIYKHENSIGTFEVPNGYSKDVVKIREIKKIYGMISHNYEVTDFGNIIFEGEKGESYIISQGKENLIGNWIECFESQSIETEINVSEEISSEMYYVESRSLDSYIAFPCYDGFTYSIFKEEECVFSKIDFNSKENISTNEEKIVIDGLREGEAYTVRYSGLGEEITVDQSEVGGELDKMYVYNSQFTFMSFVPYGTNSRPLDDDLVYDKDGISTYDKCDYYTSDDRQSFLVDNFSGLIYPIKDFNIEKIIGNLIVSENGKYVYDFNIEDEKLKIVPVLANETIEWKHCFKDKYGHSFIYNDKLSKKYLDEGTYFFNMGLNENSIDTIYAQTSTNEAIVLKYANFRNHYQQKIIYKATIIGEDGLERSLRYEDCFDIIFPSCYCVETGAMEVVNGVLKFKTYIDDINTFNLNYFAIGKYDGINDEVSFYEYGVYNSSSKFCGAYLSEYGYLLEYTQGSIYAFSPYEVINENWNDMTAQENSEWLPEANKVKLISSWTGEDLSLFDKQLIVSDVGIESDGKIIEYGPLGNKYIDIILERNEEIITFKAVESGTYVSEAKSLIIQPINR